MFDLIITLPNLPIRCCENMSCRPSIILSARFHSDATNELINANNPQSLRYSTSHLLWSLLLQITARVLHIPWRFLFHFCSKAFEVRLGPNPVLKKAELHTLCNNDCRLSFKHTIVSTHIHTYIHLGVLSESVVLLVWLRAERFLLF